MFAFAIWDTRNHELFCAATHSASSPCTTRTPRTARSSGSLPSARRSQARARCPHRPGRPPPLPVLPVRAPPLTMTQPARFLRQGTSWSRGQAARSMSSATGGRCSARRSPRHPVPRSASWPFFASRSPPTCAVTCHLARSCPAGSTRPCSARSRPTRPGLPTFTGRLRLPRLQRDRGGAGDRDGPLGLPTPPTSSPRAEFAARLPQIIWQLDDPMADAAAVLVWFIAREARGTSGWCCRERGQTSCSAGTASTTSLVSCARRPGCRQAGRS